MEPIVFAVVDGVVYDAGTETDLINRMNSEGIEDYDISEDVALVEGVYVEQGTLIYPSDDAQERLKRIFGAV